MKKYVCFLLTVLLLCALMPPLTAPVQAAGNKQITKRTIAIVFDNSGSMYYGGNESRNRWCRATYAMEVFASMLNDGDELLIFPMHAINLDGNKESAGSKEELYSKDNPLKINGPDQAGIVRNIYTPDPLGTPISTIDSAYSELLKISDGSEKWLIVLTDGDSFDGLGRGPETENALAKKLGPCSEHVNVLYLGIGKDAAMPNVQSQGKTVKVVKAADSSEVLSKLTEMCNLIFGRDVLPPSHLQGTKCRLDVSVSKLIVFVQGAGISDLSVTDAAGKPVGVIKGARDTKYSLKGSPREEARDESLQGMIVTYEECPIGDYQIHFSGNADSVEVYYEPDVDIAVSYYDEGGNEVSASELFPGEYTIKFYMKDGKTGQPVQSALLGDTSYDVTYTEHGTEKTYHAEKKASDSVTVSLSEGEQFDCSVDASYLSGYQVHWKGSDHGLPLVIPPNPAGDISLRISGGQSVYELSELPRDESDENKLKPFRAEVWYQGEQLVGDALGSVKITWDPELSGALILKELKGDHYDLILLHKDPDDPGATRTGDFTVPLTARYTPAESEEAVSYPTQLSYRIEDNRPPLEVKLNTNQTYFVISDIDKSEPIRAEITCDGAPLTPEQFAAATFTASCSGGIQLRQEALPEESAYLLYLEPDSGLSPGKYEISCSVSMKDEIGREAKASAKLPIELGTIPIWLKWAIGIVLLLLLIAIILAILHIKALPTKLHVNKRDCNMNVDSEDETKNTTFTGELEKRRLDIHSKYGGKKFGLVMDVKPGKGSYLKTPQAKRSAEVASASVKKLGNATITEASIGTVKYVFDEEKHRLERMPKSDKPFTVKHGARVAYSGVLMSNGEPKNFSVVTKLNFKKK